MAKEHQMTGLLFAIDQLKEKSEISDLILYFDEQNMTHQEEVISEQISDVLVKPKNMADIIKLQTLETELEKPINEQFYINQKGQLIRFVNMVRNGREL